MAPDNKKWAFLSGRNGRRQVQTGQTDLLATFVALSQVNSDFREELSNMEAPSMRLVKDDPNQGQIDHLLNRVANSIINWMTRLSISRKSMGTTAQSQLDALSAALVEVKDRRATRAEELAHTGSSAVGRSAVRAEAFLTPAESTWCDCGGRSPVANEVRYVGLMDISREENDLWNIMLAWMCH